MLMHTYNHTYMYSYTHILMHTNAPIYIYSYRTRWDKLIDIAVPALIQRLRVFRMQLQIAGTKKRIFKARLSLQDNNVNHHAHTYNHEGGDEEGGCTLQMKRTLDAETFVERRSHYLEDAMAKCWEESLLPSYCVLYDYTAIIVQLALVMSFSTVFPLTPLLAIVYNLALIRLDALKLCYTRQRPIAVKTSGIGVWEDVLQIMSVFGVLTSCCIMGITSDILQTHCGWYGVAGIVISLFLLEHLILFLHLADGNHNTLTLRLYY